MIHLVRFPAAAASGLLLAAVPARAGQIVQEGSLGGGKGTTMYQIPLEQFDSMGGALELRFVQIDLLTSVVGGGQSNGSGVPTDVYARLAADYALQFSLLAQTEAIIDTTIANQGPPVAFTLFDTDTAQVVIDEPAELAPWMGMGQIELMATVEFEIDEDPPGSVGFGAGGSVQYTVTYDYATACPADVDGDGSAGVGDLIQIITLWGHAFTDADVNADGTVDVLDIVAVILAWGPCA